jgi:ABC-2 type transport system ATP-binding protein
VLVSTHYMDEAERCHRLAILDRGALVADGTPAELCAQLQGRTLQVTAAQPRKARRALADVPGVLSVAQIGSQLRVLCDVEAADRAAMARILAAADPQARIEEVAPNLEDVFVAATRGRGREPAA